MTNFPTSGSCPNCPFTGEFRDVSPGDLLGVLARTMVKSLQNPFWVFTATSPSYNGTRWCCPSCGYRLIECNTCHAINLDRTTAIGDQLDCRSCGKRIV
jgi:hypothetical protein